MLYDVSSSYVEGRCCPLAKRGYNRDGKKGKLQIVYGLLCAPAAVVAIEVFEGNTGDPMTLADQVSKLKRRFAIDHVVLVGDRGMITQARIDEDLRPAGLDWITALRAPALKELVGGGHLQMSLFDERDMAAITSPDFPGERLIVCRNPDLARERARKREDLLAATKRNIAKTIMRQRGAQPPSLARRGRDRHRGRRRAGRHKMAKHFELTIADDRFAFARKREQNGRSSRSTAYAIAAGLPEETLADNTAVKTYKSLAMVERAFRCLKTVDLHVRPIYHWLEDRVRAHVFLCMLAYYVEWHMRERLAPMLYDDDDKAAAEALRESPVAKAQRSPAALAKSATGRAADGAPVHSFQTLLADLATLARNTVVTANAPSYRAD